MTKHIYSGRLAATVGVASLAMAGFLFASPAFAGTGLSVTPNFPSSVTVGDTSVAVNLIIGNASTADEGNVTLSSITLVPSCGNSVPGCTTPDTGVFAVSASGTGHTGTSCAGDSFTIAETNATTGQVTFTRTGGSLVLAFGASCQIDFTVNVLKVPTSDASGASGVQTAQLGAANGVSALENPASGTGTDFTTVNKVSPTISTQLSDTAINAGDSIHDSATLSGATSNAGGSVTYTVYSDSACSQNAVDAGTKTVTSAVIPNSDDIQFNTAGTFYWQAVYSGDANNNGATSTCTEEVVTVSKIDSTTATNIHDASHAVVTSVTVGTPVHDSATVTPSDATGTVSFQLYSDDGCTTTSGSPDVQNVVAGVADNGAPTVANSALSYKATYSGDGKYNGSTGLCEPLSVTKLDSSVVTQIHDAAEAVVTSVDVGATVHDSATVTPSDATGTVHFIWYTNSTCDGDGSAAGAVAVSAGVAHPSDSEGSLAAGSYSFKAVYSGDDKYNGSTADCEPLTVNKLSSSVVTEIHDASEAVVTSVDAGSTVHDSATVTPSDATGTVDFTWYANGTCDGEGTAAGSANVVSGVAHPSNSEGPLSAGSYSFQATYSGDSKYNGSTGDCEPLTVNQVVLQYCSPGYWKQPQHFDSYVNYSPDDLFDTVFGVTAFGGKTLVQVLSLGGGGLNAYGRAAVGALLNADALNSGLTPAEVIAKVQATIAGAPSNPKLLNSYYGSANPEFTAPENCPLN